MSIGNSAACRSGRGRVASRAALMLAFAGAALAGCATVGYPFDLVDARTETRAGSARGTADGAEVVLADDAIAPTLVERLAHALEVQLGEALAGREVSVERARATLYVADAQAAPARLLRPGRPVPVLRDTTLDVQKRVIVEYAGRIGDRPFAGYGEEHFRLGDGSVELTRAIGIALNAAVNDARAGLE